MISTLLEAIFLHGFQEHGVKVMTLLIVNWKAQLLTQMVKPERQNHLHN